MNQKILSLISELQEEAEGVLRAIDILREVIRTETPFHTSHRKLGIIATEIAGKTLGDIPIKKLSKAGQYRTEKRTGLRGKKRPYTKKAAFWNKPHPRKKKK